MTVALIQNNPKAILQIYDSTPPRLDLPSGVQVDGASVPWTSQDGAYSLVAVTSFVVPSGQEITGVATYGFDQNGNVIETYQTVLILAPTPAPVIQIKSTSTPAVNGSYPLSAITQLAQVAEYIAVNSKFPDGLAQIPILDVSGTPHLFPTTALFMAFVTAMGDYVAALDLGNPPPVQPSVIP